MKEQNIQFNIPKLAIFAKGAIDENKIGRVCELHYHDELEFLNILFFLLLFLSKDSLLLN